MLTEDQGRRVWRKLYWADVRSAYFGELANRYTKYKQVITGISFFLSSGAAATLLAGFHWTIPLGASLLTAILTSYSIAINLDGRIRSMSKLHYEWNRLHTDYQRLWDHWYEDDAQRTLDELVARGTSLSEIGITEDPCDEELYDKWIETLDDQYATAAA